MENTTQITALYRASMILSSRRAMLGKGWADKGSILDRARQILWNAQRLVDNEAMELERQARERKRWAEAVLANDESSTDQELMDLFMNEGFSNEEATAMIGRRDEFLSGDLTPEDDGEPADGGEIDFNAETGRERMLEAYREKYSWR